MKQSTSVAKRYAEALLNVAMKFSRAEEYSKKLMNLAGIVQLEIVKDFLMNPAIGKEEKVDVLCSSLGDVDEFFRNFVEILVVRKRTNCIPLISDYYSNSLDERMGRMRVWVISAKRLNGEELGALKNILEKMKKVDVDIQMVEDPKLIGGVRIFFDSEMVDLSIKGELEKIENELFSA